MLVRVLRSLAGLALLAVGLVGVPAALVFFGGDPLPQTWSWEALVTALTTPDVGGVVVTRVLLWAGWIGWAVFALSVLVELISQISGLRIRIPGLTVPRKAVGPLVSLVLSAITLVPAASTALPAAAPLDLPTAPVGITATTAAEDTAGSSEEAVAHSEVSVPGLVWATHTVSSESETLWEIAAHVYGDGQQWSTIAQANPELVGERGERHLEVGMELVLPGVSPQQQDQEVAGGPQAPDLPLADTGNAGEDDVADAETEDVSYTVEKGDTLSEIAEDYYGDGNDYTRIAEANDDQIADPDVIDIGWQLTVPDVPVDDSDQVDSDGTGSEDEVTGSDSEAEASLESADQSESESGGAEGDGSASGGGDLGEDETQPEDPAQGGSADTGGDVGSQEEQPGEEGAAPPIEHAGESAKNPAESEHVDGAGTVPSGDPDLDDIGADIAPYLPAAAGLLAAGLLSVLTTRWAINARRRRPGQKLPTPSVAAHHATTGLRNAETPLAAAHLDHALRLLSHHLTRDARELPEITAVRLADDRIDLLLTAELKPPPAPFRAADAAAWSITREDLSQATDADAEIVASTPAPYPSLTTVGTDAEGAAILVDLEAIGALTITDHQPHQILSAMALELATSRWADDITITLVGALDSLPDDLGIDRLRRLPSVSDLVDALTDEAKISRDLLAAEGLSDGRQGRADAAGGSDTWTPHIILIAQPLAPAEARALGAVLDRPRIAIAAVTTDSDHPLSNWSLVSDSDDPSRGTLHPLDGLTLDINRITEDTYADISAAARESQAPHHEPAPWWSTRTNADEANGFAPDIIGPQQTSDPDLAPSAAAATITTTTVTTSWPGDDTDTLVPGRRAAAASATNDDEQNEEGEEDDFAPDPVLARRAATADNPPVTESPAAETEAVDETVEGADNDHSTASDEAIASLTDVDQNTDDQNTPVETSTPGTPAATGPDQTGEEPDLDEIAPDTVASLVTVPLPPIDTSNPTLRLLGDIDLVGARGDIASKRSPAELYEVIAWIHMHPGRPTSELRQALAQRTNTFDALVSRARRLLGTTPEGEKLLPPARRDGQRRFYDLHPTVTSDWAIFTDLLDGGVNVASTSVLRQALTLVRGRPIATAAPGQWSWIDPVRETMVAMITDTAHVLATRALTAGDLDLARWAIAQGQLADPITEILIRDEIRTARAAGHHTHARHLARKARATAAETGVDLDTETIDLLHELGDVDRRRHA